MAISPTNRFSGTLQPGRTEPARNSFGGGPESLNDRDRTDLPSEQQCHQSTGRRQVINRPAPGDLGQAGVCGCQRTRPFGARPLALQRSRLFDQQAEAYDRFRPNYPDAVIDELLGPMPAGLDVLDVGCGTGIASRQIAQRGAKVLGVELAPRMAEIPTVIGSTWRSRPSKPGTLLVALSTG